MVPRLRCGAPSLRHWPAAWGIAFGLALGSIPTDALAHTSTTQLDDAGGKKKKGKKKKGKKESSSEGKTEDEPAAPALLDPTGPSPSAPEKAEPEKAEPEKAAPEKAAPGDPEPATTTTDDGQGFSVIEPIKIRGKLSKSSRATLTSHLKTAASTTTVPRPLRLRLHVNASKKRSYKLTLTVLAEDDSTVAEHRDGCSGCTLDDAGQRIEALVATAAAELQPAPTPPPEPAAPGPGKVTIRSVPLGAMVNLDGKDQGPTPQTLELPAGEHTLVLTKPGFGEHRETLKVQADAEQSVEPTLVADAAPTPQGDPAAARPYTISGAVMLSLGLAGVATGVAMILIDEDPMPFKCPDERIDFRGTCRYRYKTLLGGIIGVAAGGLGVGGGITLLIKGHLVKVRGNASADQASLGLSLRF